MHLCAKIKDINIAKALLAAGADIHFQNNHKKTPQQVAKLIKNDALYSLITSKSTTTETLQELINQYLPYLNQFAEEESIQEQTANNTQDNSQMVTPSKELSTNENENNEYKDEDREEADVDLNSLLNFIDNIDMRVNRLIAQSQMQAEVQESETAPQESHPGGTDLMQVLTKLDSIENRINDLDCQTSERKANEENNEQQITSNETPIEAPIKVPNEENQHVSDRYNDQLANDVKQEIDEACDLDYVLLGSGAICDVCGDPAVTYCSVCSHKFCQNCLGSTKHIEFHLE